MCKNIIITILDLASICFQHQKKWRHFLSIFGVFGSIQFLVVFKNKFFHRTHYVNPSKPLKKIEVAKDRLKNSSLFGSGARSRSSTSQYL